MKVFVVDMLGKPAMPCSPRTARLLLKSKKAVVHDRNPFTIRMTVPVGKFRQNVTMGIDPGYRHIGISVSTEREELYAAEAELRTDISERLSTKREWRRTRRSRLRHRRPRFDNRRRPESWLAPSVRARIDAHFNLISRLLAILPVTKIVIETAAFDIQKIKNPDISGTGYQEGEQLGFWNVREYVLFRDGHECRHCHGKSKDPALNVHHLESRKTGGDAPGNLVTLCETCHKKLHKGEISLDVKRCRSFRPEIFMGVMRKFLLEKLRKAVEMPVAGTFGYITKNMRIRNGIEKSHCNDAFCIAGNLKAKPLENVVLLKQVRKRGRQANKANLVKGNRWLAKKTDYMINGFCRYDRVLHNGVRCFVWGLRKRGSFLLRNFFGEKVGDASCRKLIFLEKAQSWLSECTERRFLTVMKYGVPTPNLLWPS